MIVPGTQRTDTLCPYCALQCGMTLERAPSGAWSVHPRDFPTNKGGLCRKGWTAAQLLTHPDRLTTPLMRERKDTALRPVSWDTAMAAIVERIAFIQARHGKNAIAVFGGGGLTNEKAYLLGKFARVVLGTANIDYNGRFCMSAAAVAGVRAFGIDRGLPFPLEDLPGAETILITGGNPAETMPPLMQYFDAQRARGGKLIVSDPRRTATARLANLHLQLTPGTDAALANGLLHVAIRDRLIDPVFIAQRTTGWEAVRRNAAAYWPDRVERETGAPAAQIVLAAHMLGEATTAIILSGRGTEQQSQGVQNALAFINLALALGKAGRKHCGLGCLTGQGNGQGGREHGLKSDQLPGYRRLDDARHRDEVARVWAIDPDTLPPPGLHATAMIESLAEPGGIQGLLLLGSNLLVSAPASGGLAARLDRLGLFVACDHFLNESSERVDIVLPVTQWAEESGTMTNLEGRVIRRAQAAIPPTGCAATSTFWRISQPGSAARATSPPTRRPPTTNSAAPAPAVSSTITGSASNGSQPRMACSGHAATRTRPTHGACSSTASATTMAAPALLRPRPLRRRRHRTGNSRSISPPDASSRSIRLARKPDASRNSRKPSLASSSKSIPIPPRTAELPRARAHSSPPSAAAVSFARG